MNAWESLDQLEADLTDVALRWLEAEKAHDMLPFLPYDESMSGEDVRKAEERFWIEWEGLVERCPALAYRTGGIFDDGRTEIEYDVKDFLETRSSSELDHMVELVQEGMGWATTDERIRRFWKTFPTPDGPCAEEEAAAMLHGVREAVHGVCYNEVEEWG